MLFVLTVWLTRYVSLGSIAATLALPPAAWLAGAPAAVVSAASGSAALILFRHRANFRRLRAGTERRMGRQRETA
jgi:glycerol-3-phosphate acyltransferase PlsY